MKVLVVGAGGVGGYYGAMLARAGHDVFFIARGYHLAALEDNGLMVKSFKGDFHVKAKYGRNAEDFGEADLVLVCVKSYDTEKSLDLYALNVGRETLILSLQNGIDNERIIAAEYGWERTLGGVAFIGTRVSEPGVILHTAFGHITIGAFEKATRKKIRGLSVLFKEAGIKCKVSDDIRWDLYAKMVWNVGFNAVCAILDCPAKEAVSFDNTKEIVEGAMTEWIKVARADGVDLSLSLAEKNIDVTLKGGEVIPSMLHDRRLSRRMEIDTFNGKVSQLGEKLGVKTPINDTLAGIVRFYNHRLGKD